MGGEGGENGGGMGGGGGGGGNGEGAGVNGGGGGDGNGGVSCENPVVTHLKINGRNQKLCKTQCLETEGREKFKTGYGYSDANKNGCFLTVCPPNTTPGTSCENPVVTHLKIDGRNKELCEDKCLETEGCEKFKTGYGYSDVNKN